MSVGFVDAQSSSLDVSAYPADMQRSYRLMADKCSRCHALSRPLGASYTTPQQWRDVVSRMARMPGGAISRGDQEAIVKFLAFHTAARAGLPRPSPGTGSAEADPRHPNTAASEPAVITRDGIRIEAVARDPQSVRHFRDGRWVEEAPRGDETMYLVIRVLDEETHEKLPYAVLSARVLGQRADIGAECALVPALGPDGFHYGANLAVAPGRCRIAVTVKPLSLSQVVGTTLRLTKAMTVEIELAH